MFKVRDRERKEAEGRSRSAGRGNAVAGGRVTEREEGEDREGSPEHVRLLKVLRLRSLIEQGRYAIDSSIVAECVLQALRQSGEM